MLKGFWQDLDGYVAPELGVVRLIHLSHAACANLHAEFIGTETRTRADGHYFFPAGTFCFNSSNQFSTTLIWVDACSLALSIKKR